VSEAEERGPQEDGAQQPSRVVEFYPPPKPDDELPPPTFRQALVGYGSIMLGLVLLGLLLGAMMRFLR
jgi:hypothetical protein